MCSYDVDLTQLRVKHVCALLQDGYDVTMYESYQTTLFSGKKSLP